jgi:predicted alpha/beta superfamily hydrolase
MPGRLAICSAVLAGIAWPCKTQSVRTNQEPRHCSVVGDLEIRPFTSKIFHNTRMLRVWLPPTYKSPEHPNDRYPVMYLNDGQDLFDACTSMFSAQEWQADETATELIQTGKVPALIIVGIDNAGKRDRPKEYLPYPDDTLRPSVLSVRGKEYPKFLLDEVIPFIDREYRTDSDPAKTGLGGSSYGAGIALYTVMRHPGRFGKLLLESPSLYAHDNFLLHEADRFTRWPDKVFIGVGSISEPVGDVHQLQETLRRHGLGTQQLLVVEQAGAAHNEGAWAQRFPRALRFLYSREAIGSASNVSTSAPESAPPVHYSSVYETGSITEKISPGTLRGTL